MCLSADRTLRYRVLMQPDKLKALYPNLNEEELVEAADNLDRYLALASEIYEDMQRRNQ